MWYEGTHQVIPEHRVIAVIATVPRVRTAAAAISGG